MTFGDPRKWPREIDMLTAYSKQVDFMLLIFKNDIGGEELSDRRGSRFTIISPALI